MIAALVDVDMHDLVGAAAQRCSDGFGPLAEGRQPFAEQFFLQPAAGFRGDREIHPDQLHAGLQFTDQFAGRLEVATFQANLGAAPPAVQAVVFAVDRVGVVVAAAGLDRGEGGTRIQGLVNCGVEQLGDRRAGDWSLTSMLIWANNRLLLIFRVASLLKSTRL